MSSKLLRDAGEALYGARWQSDMARDLGMSDRHVRRLVAGTSGVRPGVYVDLIRLVVERQAALDAILDRLKRAGAPCS